MQRKPLSYWQLSSVVINEGKESYTTNLCQMCFDNFLKVKGEKPLTNVQWRQVVEKKGVPWKDLENDGKRTICTWDVGILFSKKETE